MFARPVVSLHRHVLLSVGLGLTLLGSWITAAAVADHAVRPPVAQHRNAPGAEVRHSRSALIGRTFEMPSHDALSASRNAAAAVAAAGHHLEVDRTRDRRADLMDMAIAIRWHRGSPSGLSPSDS